MNTLNRVNILFIFFISIIVSQEDCQDGRYIDDIFDVSVQYGVQYGQNISENILGSEFNQTLYMDIYEPEGDTLNQRPVIIFIHAGSFFSGSNEADE